MPSLVSAEIAARQPVDYVCVDTQHGVIDYQVSASMIQAIELTGGSPIVRVPWNEPGIIGKSLDAGAHGVIVPMVNTRTQAEAVVRSARYAPEGARSWGPVMGGMRHDDYRRWAAETIAVIPMIETAEAIADLDEILSVSGVERSTSVPPTSESASGSNRTATTATLSSTTRWRRSSTPVNDTVWCPASTPPVRSPRSADSRASA